MRHAPAHTPRAKSARIDLTMAWFSSSASTSSEGPRQRPRPGRRNPNPKPELKRSTLLAFSLFALFTALTVAICFVGLSQAGPLILKDHVSRLRVTAEIPFQYTSAIQTNQLLEEQRQRIPPVFVLDLSTVERFAAHLRTLFDELTEFAAIPANATNPLPDLKVPELKGFRDFNNDAQNPFGLRPEDVVAFYNALPDARRNEILNEALILLRDIHQRGIHGSDSTITANFNAANASALSLFQLEDANGNIQTVDILSEQDALRNLRINIAALDTPREATLPLFRILRNGITPNVRFDSDRTQQRIAQAQDAIQPVRVSVAAGDTIIDPNSRVTALEFEQLQAYRQALRLEQQRSYGLDSLLLERSLLTILIIAAAAFYLRLLRIRFEHNVRVFLLSAAVILLNLLLIRAVMELADSAFALNNPLLPRLIPFLLPVIIGPIILTILVGPRQGILAAALVSTLAAIMQGNAFGMGILSMLVALTSIHFCRNVQLRASLVRAGIAAGSVLAIGTLPTALHSASEPLTILYQILAALANGTLSAILIVGILPLLEQLFRYTSDITLLELTDFNHPLLRKMQVEAPGSYHHSLMVANLSENAANAIGANTLLCRVCALFHDVGKMVKPEYFAENQHDGINPHIERNPSMSALVIKSHVKEGVQLARDYRLPTVIIDVIRQHHGTSLIQYFYYKALEQQRSEKLPSGFSPNAPRIELDTVNEATYRYEGPIPQFTESAIIMLADSIEAASRSLRKVTPQAIDELLDKIFYARLEDGQLDATPITFQQLNRIKESFAFTLLNMLHARVEYPDAPDSPSAKRARKRLPQPDLQPDLPPSPNPTNP